MSCGRILPCPAGVDSQFAKLQINDYCSDWELLVFSEINLDAAIHNRPTIRSADDKTALWAGAIDDNWQLGKPVAVGLSSLLDTNQNRGRRDCHGS